MLKPHPRGPRIFRNLFEPKSSHFNEKEPTTMSTLIRNAPKILRTPSPAIDLTRFAGRFGATSGTLTTGFELPPSFFSRLKVVHPAELAEIDQQQLAVDA